MTRPRYRSADEDSARWDGFRFRDGDIVISTRSKSGTTWLQMICALLVFQTPSLPAPLADLSPWLDWRVRPIDEVRAGLDAQSHRRFVKTHTPLDGLPRSPRATYLVVARHPLDVAVSLYHQGDNLDRARLTELTGLPPSTPAERPPLGAWLRDWLAWDGDPRAELDSLPGLFHHVGDAWRQRAEPDVVLVHYADLSADLEGSMRSLAARLGFTIAESRWPALVDAARFESMRARADELAPDRLGVLKDTQRFFRGGRSGDGRAALDPEDRARYAERAAALAGGDADLLAWLHRP